MAASLLYQEEMFVVLETAQAEVFLTPEELTQKLQILLENERYDIVDLPRSLEKFLTPVEQAVYLRDNFCELERANGDYLQWYVVRLEK